MKRIRILAISVGTLAMVLAFGTNAMAAHGTHRGTDRGTDVFCDAGTFYYCSDTYRYVNSSDTFTGWGSPQTDYVGFTSNLTGEAFYPCTFVSSDRLVDRYACSSAQPSAQLTENPKKDNKGKNHKGKNHGKGKNHKQNR